MIINSYYRRIPITRRFPLIKNLLPEEKNFTRGKRKVTRGLKGSKK